MPMTDSAIRAADPARFRAQFPVFDSLSYLNAGTEGPVPARAGEAVHRRVDLETLQGRGGKPYFEGLMGMRDRVRESYAAVIGARPEDVALTGSTTDGVNTVIAGLDLRAGDEILTTEEEHPGLLAPLGRARVRHGVKIREVPFAEIANEVTSSTRLIACSHVSWVSGRIVDAQALAATGVPVLLDAAQAIGAIPVDVEELGCAFYAASGQKWLCGPEGSGCLYVREAHLDDLLVPWPSYGSVAEPQHALEFEPAEGTARLDHGFPTGVRSTWTLASLEVFDEAGWPWVHERAATLAASFADRLRERGLEVLERDRSTLVSWKAQDPEAVVQRLAAEDVIVRFILPFGLVRASVGAWSSDEELDRVAALAAA
jgi:L-cysteine/cystine lyase